MSAEPWRAPRDVPWETFLRLYPALPASLCDEARTAFNLDREGRSPGETVGGLAPAVKLSTDLAVGARALALPSLWEHVELALREAAIETFGAYLAEVPGACWLRGPLAHTGFVVQRYAPGRGRYLEHVDADGHETMRRVAAGIFYLNDDFEGGETSFPAWRVRVRPRKGHVLWFPAGFQHVHVGEVPRGGAKYVATTFQVFAEDGLRYRKPGRRA